MSVIVPVYNEEELLAASVGAIDAFLARHFKDYEVILVESGSTDASGAICDGLAAGHPRARVIHEGARNGFGAACRLGFREATKDLVWVITADMPFPLEAVLEALPLLDRHDCVLSRRSRDTRSIFRRFQSVVWNFLVKRALGLKVTNVNSAFKVFKREVIQSMPLESNGWLIESEIIYRIAERNVPHVEIPVELIDRTAGRPSVGLFTWWGMYKELRRFVRSRRGP
jgi:glycosyltransferase involved in cell wall biosynthesis